MVTNEEAKLCILFLEYFGNISLVVRVYVALALGVYKRGIWVSLFIFKGLKL